MGTTDVKSLKELSDEVMFHMLIKLSVWPKLGFYFQIGERFARQQDPVPYMVSQPLPWQVHSVSHSRRSSKAEEVSFKEIFTHTAHTIHIHSVHEQIIQYSYTGLWFASLGSTQGNIFYRCIFAVCEEKETGNLLIFSFPCQCGWHFLCSSICISNLSSNGQTEQRQSSEVKHNSACERTSHYLFIVFSNYSNIISKYTYKFNASALKIGPGKLLLLLL